eukprot:Selendium_serpulae@DN6450_c2_g7_i1.p1
MAVEPREMGPITEEQRRDSGESDDSVHFCFVCGDILTDNVDLIKSGRCTRRRCSGAAVARRQSKKSSLLLVGQVRPSVDRSTGQSVVPCSLERFFVFLQ